MERTLLLVDDDVELVAALTEYLGKFGFHVVTAHTPSAGLAILRSRPIDLVVLDVMLPEKDGMQVCREIRALGDVPVVMLTARADLADRIVGLEIGADDYVAKPFEPRELVARLEAVLRRPRKIEKRRTLKYEGLEIDLREHSVRLRGELVEFTSTEFSVLVLLASHPGTVYSRDQIMDHLRGAEQEAFSRTIDVLLSRVRSKLHDDPKKPKFIKTVWGSGYVFLGALDEAA